MKRILRVMLGLLRRREESGEGERDHVDDEHDDEDAAPAQDEDLDGEKMCIRDSSWTAWRFDAVRMLRARRSA